MKPEHDPLSTLPDSSIGIPLFLPVHFPGRDKWLQSRGFESSGSDRLDPRSSGVVLRLAAEFDADRLGSSPEARGIAPLPGGFQVLAELPGAAANCEEPWSSLVRWSSRVGPEVRLDLGRNVFRRVSIGSPLVMGIVNVTPDSFSDGGEFLDPDQAFSAAIRMLDEGAEIVDVGGESTRPGAAPVSVEEETRRVVPVIERISAARPAAVISVDTRNAQVAQRAASAGARMINDVSGLRNDPAIAAVAAGEGLAVVLGHMRGTPESMQREARYLDLVGEVADALADSVDRARQAGVPFQRILIDPGIGFGKTGEHNIEILRALPVFRAIAAALVIGVSRKRFLGEITGRGGPKERLGASLAAAAAAAERGVSIVRVHDVGETADGIKVRAAIG